jgi:Fe-S-cluster containining protein
MSARSIRTPKARFSCASCGRCCTMWSVTVDEQKVAKLREHDWSSVGAGDPFEKNRGPGDAYRLKLVNGRCFFLDQQNRCHIHAKLGYDAKPEGCKAFPLHFVEVDGVSYGRLSFWCPTVTKNEGKQLRDQNRWLKTTRKAAGDVKREAKLTLDDSLELSTREVDAILERQQSWVEDNAQPMATRLAACAGFIELLCELCEEDGKRAISQAHATAEKDGLEKMAVLGKKDGRAARAGPVLSLYLGADAKPGKLARLGRFFAVRLFNMGLGPLRSKAVDGKASRSAIRAVAFDPPTANDELLTRYFLQKIESRRTVAGEASLLAGTNLLLVAYTVINLLARVSAAKSGRKQCDEHDVAAAVQAADLLVVEHSTLQHGAMFGQLVDTIIAQRSLGASLLARIERG